MTTMAVSSSDCLNTDGSKTYQIRQSPSKKIKIETNDDISDVDDVEYEPECGGDLDEHGGIDVKMKAKTRKRPPVVYRLGDVMGGVFESRKREKNGGGVEEEPRSSSSASVSIFSDGGSETRRISYEPETEPAILERRRKQIEYGKNTPEYHTYTKSVPRESRDPVHPRTPNMKRKYSRRAWDGLIRQWRINLHLWSSPEALEMNNRKHDESFCSDGSFPSLSEASSAALHHPKKRYYSSTESNPAYDDGDGGEDDESDEDEEEHTFELKQENVELTNVKVEVKKETNVKVENSWSEQVENYLEDQDDEDDGITVTV